MEISNGVNKKIKIIIAIVLVIVLVLAGYVAYKKYFNKSTLENKTLPTVTILPKGISKTSKSGSKTPTSVSGFKLYKNSDFGFEIQYPNSWTVSEEEIINVRGEHTKAFYFKKPGSDLRFAILPRDGLSYGLPGSGTSSEVFIGGSLGMQTQFTLADGRRLWLLSPQYDLGNWLQDIGRIDILSSATDPVGDTRIFEQMLNSFKFSR